jgi:hypothetical protein
LPHLIRDISFGISNRNPGSCIKEAYSMIL